MDLRLLAPSEPHSPLRVTGDPTAPPKSTTPTNARPPIRDAGPCGSSPANAASPASPTPSYPAELKRCVTDPQPLGLS